ncbi:MULTISPECIES: helix-turn-helix domain-containing protein [unclassified Serratia (in: enterobacteria)]|uniref:helix-turn-helix domain-containing protein n=1 Tax=unclassified Serratia (in: enterobacteria) TaxID=2647522 RepID=UPI00046AE08C|nr:MULTISPECIES: helix-turn-helix transcriptional regulator [unclassified Serratia (in: enterobacteria)]
MRAKIQVEDFEFPIVSEREMACERLLFNTTEDILLAMQDSGVTQSVLAKKIGKSRPYVSKLLDGTRNMTLKTLADISFALGAEAKVAIIKDGRDVSHHLIPERQQYITTSNNISTKSAYTIKIKLSTQKMEYTKCC